MSKKITLTDAKMNAIKPRKKEFTLWDRDIAGFGLRVRPNGSKRLIYLRDGKKVTLKSLSVAEARDECLNLRFNRNADSNKGYLAKSITFGEYVQDEWKRRRYDLYASNTKKSQDYCLKNILLPAFGDKYLHEVTKRGALKWFEKESLRSAGAANFALQSLRQIFNRARRDGLIASNPTQGIALNPRPPMMRFLSGEERQGLLDILEQREKMHPKLRPNCDIIRLLMLTGCRKSEIVEMKWAWIREGQIHLPQSKTGGRIVWLSKEAEAIIARQPKTGSQFVFPHPEDLNRCHPFSHAFWRTTRCKAGLKDVRIHDLRHSFASHAIQQGVPLPIISKLMGHSNLRMTLRYAHVSDREVKTAAERVGSAIANWLNGERS